MDLSVVTTLYYSEAYIDEFYSRIIRSLRKITKSYEIIFVNDGSPDRSLTKLLKIYHQDKRIKIIDLSRNFGHHKAVLTGLSHAQGKYIFYIDSDLEEDPEMLETYWKEIIKSPHVDAVFGVQKNRSGGFQRRVIEKMFYKIFNLFSEIKLTENTVMTRIMTQRFVKALVKHGETHPVFAGLCELTGFQQKTIIVNKDYKNGTTYTFLIKFAVLANSITSFSEKPLVFIALLGIFIILISVITIMYVIYARLIYGKLLEGWMSLIISLWFLGGLILLSIGIIGVYLAKIFIQVKNRPFTIIRKIYQR